jgi:hypothetical protein
MMIGFFLLDSKCATELKERYYMHKLFEFMPINATLKYRASENGWKDCNFEFNIPKLYFDGLSISLFKIKDGDCIGGLTINHLFSTDPLGVKPFEILGIKFLKKPQYKHLWNANYNYLIVFNLSQGRYYEK